MSVARVNRRFCRSCAGCRSTGRRPTVNALSAVLTAAGGAALPGAVAALADTKDAARAVRGELLLRLFNELETHRLPARAKKAVARFRMSRSWRRISFSRRSRFGSFAMSGDADPPGASAARFWLRRSSGPMSIASRDPSRSTAEFARSSEPGAPPRPQIPL